VLVIGYKIEAFVKTGQNTEDVVKGFGEPIGFHITRDSELAT
jgi:hypothetical protein